MTVFGSPSKQNDFGKNIYGQIIYSLDYFIFYFILIQPFYFLFNKMLPLHTLVLVECGGQGPEFKSLRGSFTHIYT